MSEMIERVAQAMWWQRRLRADNAGIDLPAWEEDARTLREAVFSEALAAIEAMLEPTDEMLRRGSAAAEVCDDGWESNATWRAMVEAALSHSG